MSIPTSCRIFPPGCCALSRCRAVALGRHVRHADGEIASFLTQDFSQFRPEVLATATEEWDTAVQFVMLAATLHSSLLAPATHAPSLLHTFQLAHELPCLASIVSILPTTEMVRWHSTRRRLKTVRARPLVHIKGKIFLSRRWKCGGRARSRQVFYFAPAAKAGSKWREPCGLLHALVTRIQQNDAAKISSVKQALEKLADDAYFQDEVERTDRGLLKRRLGDAISGRTIDQLQTAMRKAVEFARQWIDMQEGQGKKSQGMSPEQLQKHIWGKQAGIKEELATFKRRQPSRLVQIIPRCTAVLHSFSGPLETFRVNGFVLSGALTQWKISRWAITVYEENGAVLSVSAESIGPGGIQPRVGGQAPWRSSKKGGLTK